MAKYRKRKLYPSDVGMRWCIPCGKQVYFKWSDSRNTFVCELCEYQIAMNGENLLRSEADFLIMLKGMK